DGIRYFHVTGVQTCALPIYLSPDEVSATVADRLQVELTPFAAPEAGGRKVFHAGARAGRSFAEERADPNANVFAVAARHIVDERAKKRRVIIAGWTEGSLDRLTQILTEHDLGNLKRVETLDEAGKLGAGQ